MPRIKQIPENITQHKLKMKKLSSELEGHLKRVADESGYNIMSVLRVLRGDYVNWNIIRAAIKIRNKIIAEKLQQQKLLEKI